MSLGLWWGWHWMCRFLWAIQPFLTVFILSVHKQRGVCPPSSFFFSVLCMIKLWLYRSLACLVGVISRYFFFWSYQWCFSAEFSFNSLDFTFPVVLFFLVFLLNFFLCCWVFIQIDDFLNFFISDFSSMFTVDCFPWVLNWVYLLVHSFLSQVIDHFYQKAFKIFFQSEPCFSSVSSEAELRSFRAILLHSFFLLIVSPCCDLHIYWFG